MPKAEGRSFQFESESSIDPTFLEAIAYDGDPQFIEYKTTEFSAVCPFSGLPDYGQLMIQYIPSKAIIELKSLKYYLISFRQVGIYQEKATDLISRTLWARFSPQYLKVTTIYNTRGGIDTTCYSEKGSR